MPIILYRQIFWHTGRGINVALEPLPTVKKFQGERGRGYITGGKISQLPLFTAETVRDFTMEWSNLQYDRDSSEFEGRDEGQTFPEDHRYAPTVT